MDKIIAQHLFLIYSVLIFFYRYLRRSHYKVEEFFMQLQKLYLKRKDGKKLAESDFTELLAGFTRIFLLNVE